MKTAIFINGAWATPLCWRYFAPLFAERGYRTLAPAWPRKERPAADQLACPDPRLAEIGIPEILAHYKAIVRTQADDPVLIGHSFGGLIVQLLLDQGFGSAGIVISSVPPRGVRISGFSPLKMARKLWNLFGNRSQWRGILPPPRRDAEEQARRRAQGIETHLVPESRRIFCQLLTSAAAVDFTNPNRAPLLLVGCGKDRLVPAEAQHRNWARYRSSRTRTDFILAPDLTHLAIAEPGHQALAAYCLAWADDRVGYPATRVMAPPSPFQFGPGCQVVEPPMLPSLRLIRAVCRSRLHYALSVCRGSSENRGFFAYPECIIPT